MPYINKKTWAKILDAKKSGDERAINICKKFYDRCGQDELDSLVNEYLSPVPVKSKPETEAIVEIEAAPDNDVNVDVSENLNNDVDISEDLDKELDGLIDDDVIDEDDFETYLKKKKNKSNRTKKDAGYFAAFDSAGRKNYYAKKTDEKKHQYDDKRRDIERAYNDMSKAIGKYLSSVKKLPDDDNEYNFNNADEAYGGIIKIGRSFGRGWDEQDVSQVVSELGKLAEKYGKKNVIAALNLISQDNLAFRNGKISSIDKSVKKYGDSLKKIIGGN